MYPQVLRVIFTSVLILSEFLKSLLLFQPDYDQIEDDNRVKLFSRVKSDKGKDRKKYGLFDSFCE